jgi:hypothetical protein
MKNQIPTVFIITAIIVIAVLIAGFRMPESVSSNVTPAVTPSLPGTPDLNRTNFYLKYFPAEIQGEVRTLAGESLVDISYWGFDPINNEINLYDNGIQNESAVNELRGKKIGNYTVHVMNGTEILNAQEEVQNQLSQLRMDPKYQIGHISMGPDETINPPRYFVELVCNNYTPANKELDYRVIRGWRIQVFVCCAVPGSTGNASKAR